MSGIYSIHIFKRKEKKRKEKKNKYDETKYDIPF